MASGRVVSLNRPSFDVPWGFRLQGGADQGSPLTVLRVNRGSAAEASDLQVGDKLLQIGNFNASQLTYAKAMEVIKDAGDFIKLVVSRSGDFHQTGEMNAGGACNKESVGNPSMVTVPNNADPISLRSPGASQLLSHAKSLGASLPVTPVRHPVNNHPLDYVGPPGTSHLLNSVGPPIASHSTNYVRPPGTSHHLNSVEPRGVFHPRNPTGFSRASYLLSPGREYGASKFSNPVGSPGVGQYSNPVKSPAHRTANFGQTPTDRSHVATSQDHPGMRHNPQQHHSLSRPRLTPERSPHVQAREVSSSPQTVPGAISNMTARGAPDKKPWAYAPDKQVLEEQSNRIRRNIVRRNSNQAMKRRELGVSYNNNNNNNNNYNNYYNNQLPQQEAMEDWRPELNTRTVNGEVDVNSECRIPSKTFQALQSITSSGNDGGGNRQNSNLALATERRRKRRDAKRADDTHTSASELSDAEFDEAYLSGRIPIFGKGGSGKSSMRPFTVPAYSYIRQDEEEARVDENKKPFDERAYLAGRIPLVQGGEIDPSKFDVPEAPAVKKYEDEDKPQLREPFDENAYLAGKLNILGGPTTDRPQIVADGNPEVKPVKPSWYKSDQELISEDEYDEDSFLKGRIPIVRRSVDRDIPVRALPPRNPNPKVRAAWELPSDDTDSNSMPSVDDLDRGVCSEPEFDERAYLAGHWRRRGSELRDYSTDGEAEIPSRTFRILRRSVSSDRSAESEPGFRNRGSVSPFPSKPIQNQTNSYSDDQLYDMNDETPYHTLIYSGRKIPSKTFSRLERTMSRKASAERRKSLDPIERLKEKTVSEGIDFEEAMEKLSIGKHDPDAYLELLKKSVEQKNIRVSTWIEAADNETTDF